MTDNLDNIVGTVFQRSMLFVQPVEFFFELGRRSDLLCQRFLEPFEFGLQYLLSIYAGGFLFAEAGGEIIILLFQRSIFGL